MVTVLAANDLASAEELEIIVAAAEGPLDKCAEDTMRIHDATLIRAAPLVNEQREQTPDCIEGLAAEPDPSRLKTG